MSSYGKYREWIRGTPVDDVRGELLTINEESDTIEKTVEGIDWNTTQPIIIEVNRFEEKENGEDAALELTLSGVGDGGYDYIQEDEELTGYPEDGQDAFALIDTTSGNPADGQWGRWWLNPRLGTRASIYGRGSHGIQGEGRTLAKGWSTSQPDDPFDLTLSASSGGEIELRATVWMPNERAEL